MADSNITKRALASALRELMEEVPFDKIQVTHICERCGMNRKSFYYHFRDKYDLVNWIFDTDIIPLFKASDSALPADNRWDLIERVCEYFYENRSFYRKALKIKGQNSFADHLREFCRPLVRVRISHLLSAADVDEFVLDFFSDALLCAIERWLLDKNCMPPEEFVAKSRHLIEGGAKAIYQETQDS